MLSIFKLPLVIMNFESNSAVLEAPTKVEPEIEIELTLTELDEILEIDVVDTVNPGTNETFG
jgi:hypothetical protein